MSGHNKWSQIKYKKEIKDSRKGKLFSRLANQISLAARDGGGKPEDNPNLRLLIDTARRAEMPKANIKRAIDRGTGEGERGQLHELTYEAYGPGGVAVIIQAVSDNPNRTVSEIKSTLNKFNGKLAQPGSVKFLFEKQGEIIVRAKKGKADEVQIKAIEAGAIEISQDGNLVNIRTPFKLLAQVREKLKNYGLESFQTVLNPKSKQKFSSKDRETAKKLLEALEGLDDVVSLSSNADFSGEGAFSDNYAGQ